MKNIFSVRKENNLCYVLGDRQTVDNDVSEYYSKVAIGVYLYYDEKVDIYLKYLGNLRDRISVYIISSNPRVIKKVKTWSEEKNNIYVLEKNNRGRDVSALLITLKNIIKQYELFCFIHDKKEKKKDEKSDVDLWIDNFLMNTIISNDFIDAVIEKFIKNDSLGLMVPPEPLCEYRGSWYGGTWGSSYEATVSVKNLLDLKCDIDEKYPVFTLGTVFWARTKALRKLLEYDWKFEDFPEEPMAPDGTISHGIERILGYVAQDSGFYTATLMSNEYVSKTYLMTQEYFRATFKVVKEVLEVGNMHRLLAKEKQLSSVVSYIDDHKEVFIYGCGNIGKSLLGRLVMKGKHIKGFIVSDGYLVQEKFGDYPVYELSNIGDCEGVGIIVAVNESVQKDIVYRLHKKNIYDFVVI